MENWQTQLANSNQLETILYFQKKDGQTKIGHTETSKSKSTSQIPQILEEIDEEEWVNRTINTLDINMEYILESIQEYTKGVWINKTNMATELAMVENLKKKDLPLEEMIPKEFHEYLDVFDEQKAN